MFYSFVFLKVTTGGVTLTPVPSSRDEEYSALFLDRKCIRPLVKVIRKVMSINPFLMSH